MEALTCTERSQSIKKQTIDTVHVFTEDNQVYTKKGRCQRYYVPLRWIPVHIPK